MFHGWNYFKCAYKSFFQYIYINTCMYFDQPFSFPKKTLLGTAYLKPATLQKHFLLLDILTILNSVTCSNYTQSSECAKVYSCIHLRQRITARVCYNVGQSVGNHLQKLFSFLTNEIYHITYFWKLTANYWKNLVIISFCLFVLQWKICCYCYNSDLSNID